jgi:hypothetical protein
MSSFFDVDEDEIEEKDTIGTPLALKGTAPPTSDVTGPSSLGFEQIVVAVTPSKIMASEEKGSSKPTLVEDKDKGPATIEEAKKAVEDDTPLGEGTRFIMLRGRSWVRSN